MIRRPRTWLLASGACLVLLALTGVLAYLVPIAHWHDSAALQGFVALNEPQRTALIDRVAHLADPVPYGLIGFALAAVAAGRGRPRVAVAIVAVLFLTGLTTQTLKPLLAQPRYDEWLGGGQIAAASWPSGHATASMTLGLLAVLAVPARWRPTAAALGGMFAVAVSFAILALGWHFPSDVVGGYLVAGTWVALAGAALTAASRRWPERPRPEQPAGPRDVLPAVGLAVAALTGAVAVAASRPRAVQDFAAEHTNFVFGALTITVAATVLAVLATIAATRTRSAA
ncbi:phosphatase PAP2 family protein [Conexibacter sp. SYSU D00693]|uniref:phosphatase PAP2 family protein n=1 Tax=Conexibacter sp. SYSU D00693 TaxID=2812560 RepID=UPI00196A419A|nr:phosphatase PAP2 family protein [Conexibacter sp. SYSU D00693]